jgi:hypothetical protein
MKKSVMTAGEIYEVVFKMRREIDELNDALTLVEDEIGHSNAAHSLLLKQKDDKFTELQIFESKKFTQDIIVRPF